MSDEIRMTLAPSEAPLRRAVEVAKSARGPFVLDPADSGDEAGWDLPTVAFFHRYECGCVGIPMPGMTTAIVVDACDADRDAPRDSLSWVVRAMGDKSSTPLDSGPEFELHQRLARRLAYADRFDAIRLALDVPS